jgi:hypothetical protein
MKCDQSIYFRLHRCFIDPDIGRQSIEEIEFAQTRLIAV